MTEIVSFLTGKSVSLVGPRYPKLTSVRYHPLSMRLLT